MKGVTSFADGLSIAAAALCCTLFGVAALATEHRLVMLNMQVTLDQVSPERGESAHTKVGQIDELRLVYDPATVDPRTHRVHLINFQHLMDGHYSPSKPDPIAMPMTDAWLDVGGERGGSGFDLLLHRRAGRGSRAGRRRYPA